MAKSSDSPEKKSYSEDLIKVIEFGGFLKPGEMYMNTDKIYQIRYNKLYRHQFSQDRTEIIYRFDSPDQMPSGEVLVYDGIEEDFIGSSLMPENNQGQLVNLLMGESSLKITSTIEIGNTVMINLSEDRLKAEEITLTAQFTNPRQKVVPVLLVYHAPRRIIKSNYKYNRKSGHTYEWLVNFQASPDKQIITISITQMADQSVTDDKPINGDTMVDLQRQVRPPKRNPPVSDKLTNYGGSLKSFESKPTRRKDNSLSMVSIQEPTRTQRFTPLNTQPIGHENIIPFNQQSNKTIPHDY